jgi:hypothetical protein
MTFVTIITVEAQDLEVTRSVTPQKQVFASSSSTNQANRFL